MAAPNDLNINSPTESSEEEFNDSKMSYSSDDDSVGDEPSESENTNGGSRPSLSSLEQKETKPSETKDDLWKRYPYLKSLLDDCVAKGLIPEYAYERDKLIGDDKAKEINDRYKALYIKELKFRSKKYAFTASVLSLMIPYI